MAAAGAGKSTKKPKTPQPTKKYARAAAPERAVAPASYGWARPVAAAAGAHGKQKMRLGVVGVSQEMHSKTHATKAQAAKCERCSYYKLKVTLERYAWLETRPSELGGEWALGCSYCSWALKHKHNHQRAYYFPKWARHAWRSKASMGRLLARIAAHSCAESHREARKQCPFAKVQPAAGCSQPLAATAKKGEKDAEAEVAPEVEVDVVAAADRRLFKGRVPQLDEWAHCWAAATTCVSMHKMPRIPNKTWLPFHNVAAPAQTAGADYSRGGAE